jgi:hypothetical protein
MRGVQRFLTAASITAGYSYAVRLLTIILQPSPCLCDIQRCPLRWFGDALGYQATKTRHINPTWRRWIPLQN